MAKKTSLHLVDIVDFLFLAMIIQNQKKQAMESTTQGARTRNQTNIQDKCCP
jgi:hypothetical protein